MKLSFYISFGKIAKPRIEIHSHGIRVVFFFVALALYHLDLDLFIGEVVNEVLALREALKKEKIKSEIESIKANTEKNR